MAYTFDNANGDIVINGWSNGIGASPETGLTDMRNVNITSIPGEAPINFETSKITSEAISGSVTSVSGTVNTFSGGIGLENYMAIYFTGLASYSGIAEATPYWIGNISGFTFEIYSDYNQQNIVTITGTGTANFTVYQIGIPPSYVGGTATQINYFAQPTSPISSSYSTFAIDGTGLVWSNFYVTGTNNYWTYTGNPVTDGTGVGGGGGGSTAFPDIGFLNSSGNGLVYWRVSNGQLGTGSKFDDFVFAFRNSQIDIFTVVSGSGNSSGGKWILGWNPNTGTTGSNNYLATPPGMANSHHAIIAPDGRLYFCDADNIQKIYQTSPTTIFNPESGNTTTFTYLTFPLLPVNDIAQCISPLGTNILIGGQGYEAYLWNTTATQISNYIPLAEPFVSKIVTVNVNAYLFIGNRGRIYITQGSQANLWAKIPDHLSGTIEPRFQWGGAIGTKEQLYFSFLTFSNSGNSITTMGGLWAIDLDTQAPRVTNQLSYGTYAGYASALLGQVYNPVASVNNSGVGLFIGWYDGVSTVGIDIPSTSIYTNGQSYIISDLIPIGTNLEPQTPQQFEFKISVPLGSGESMAIYVANNLKDMLSQSGSYALAGSVTGGTNTLSYLWPDPLPPSQWILIKAVLTGQSSNPTFNRLTEMRIKGVSRKQVAYYTTPQ